MAMSGAELLSDADLDAAFAASYDLHDQVSTAYYAAEISNRLQSVWSFVSGAFGSNRFPLYAARTGFSQSQAAQSSVADSAQNVASAAGSAVKTGLGALGMGAGLALIVGGLLLYGYVTHGRK